MSAATASPVQRSEVTREIGTVVRHSFVYGLGDLLTKAISFALLPFYTHYLSPRDYGIIEMLSLAMAVLGMCLNMGTTAAFLRYYGTAESEEEKRKILGTLFLFALATGTVIFGAGCLLIDRATLLLFGRGVPSSYLLMSFGLFMLAYIAIVPYTYLRAKEASGTLVTLDSIGVVLMLILNIYFIA